MNRTLVALACLCPLASRAANELSYMEYGEHPTPLWGYLLTGAVIAGGIWLYQQWEGLARARREQVQREAMQMEVLDEILAAHDAAGQHFTAKRIRAALATEGVHNALVLAYDIRDGLK